MFDDMMNDVISVLKPDGRRFDRLKSVVERDAIIFDDVNVPLEEGDHIERQLPGGRTELYEVLDSGFNRGGGGIPDFYHAKVRKTTSRLPRHGAGTTTHVTMTGPNARLNVGSVDASTNIVNAQIPHEVFQELIATLRAQVASPKELDTLVHQVEKLEKSIGTAAYNRAYADFVQLAANWMTIVAPFIPALTRALTQS
jgi:hypothetical protein